MKRKNENTGIRGEPNLLQPEQGAHVTDSRSTQLPCLYKCIVFRLIKSSHLCPQYLLLQFGLRPFLRVLYTLTRESKPFQSFWSAYVPLPTDILCQRHSPRWRTEGGFSGICWMNRQGVLPVPSIRACSVFQPEHQTWRNSGPHSHHWEINEGRRKERSRFLKE